MTFCHAAFFVQPREELAYIFSQVQPSGRVMLQPMVLKLLQFSNISSAISALLKSKEDTSSPVSALQPANILWKLRQEHTSLEHWEPGATGTESLWEEVNETHAGTLDDPIPYSGNMALTKGLYYIQDGNIYLCNRDTVTPVSNPLVELVGLYVEAV